MAWFLEGVNLSSLAWNVSNRSAGWSVPAKTGSNTRVPGRHGTFWNPDKTYDEGHLNLSMWAMGCDHDGSLPLTEDGRKKVRDNLDRLTSLFSTSNKLLTLRQITGTEMPIINEMTNPNLSSTLNRGVTLARNYAVDPTRTLSSTTEISTNHSKNPYMKGREASNWIATEDLYPDPQFYKNLSIPAKQQFFRSFYHPISQNTASTNRLFTPNNGFTYVTGRPGGLGALRRSTDITWTGEAHIGDIIVHKIPNPDRGVDFFMNLKLSANSPATSVSVAVRPSVSLDGIAWADVPSKSFTITKNAYTWMHIPGSSFPTMTGSPSFSVKYHLRIMTPASWKAGDYFDVDKVAIQETPAPGNPHRASLTPSLIFDGSMPGVEYAGINELSDTVVRAFPAPEWEVVMGTSSTTTAYAFAQTQRIGQGAELGFSAFGGSYQVFRRALAPTLHSFPDTKIWGKVLNTTSKTATIRVVERTGSPGSYTYTTLRSHVIPALGSHFFASQPFAVTAGKTYMIEVVAPVGPDMDPTLAFEELHVSNGWVTTNIPRGKSSHIFGPSAEAMYTRFAYQSSIRGVTGKVPETANGVPHPAAPLYTSPTADWRIGIGETSASNGALEMDKVPFSFSPLNTSRSVTTYLEMKLGLPPHIREDFSGSGTVTVKTEMLNSSDGVVRTVDNTYTVTTSWKTFTNTVTAAADEVALRTTLTYSDANNSLVTVKATKYMVFSNSEGLIFTGAEMLSGTLDPWQRLRWNGAPYFSTSTLAAAIPSVWNVNGFKGFDPDGTSIRFTGTTLRVQHRAPGGQAYVGFRRGVAAGDFTVSVKPEGAGSATSLGSITASTGFVQGYVTIPDNSNYIDFTFSGTPTHFTVRDVAVIGDLHTGVFPVPSTQWVGFTAKTPPTLSLPTHPGGQSVFQSTSILNDGTTLFEGGSVPGWSQPLLGGGYIPLPLAGNTHSISSHEVAVNKGFVSVAVVTDLADDIGSRVTLQIQGASDAERAAGTWTTLQSVAITATTQTETRIQDVAVGDKTRVRITLFIDNRTALGRSGIAGILLGATLSPSPIGLGASFPGHFVGVLNSTGTSTYKANIRQAMVEVVEAIDMSSTGLGTIAEFNVSMVVPGAFWEDIYDTTSTATAASSARSGDFLLSDFAGATAPMNDLTFTITPVSGSISNFKLEDLGSGNFIQYRGAAQSSITINTTTSTVQNASGASIIKGVTQVGTSAILSLTPYNKANGENLGNHVDGTPVLRWSANTALKITVTGRRKYLLA